MLDWSAQWHGSRRPISPADKFPNPDQSTDTHLAQHNPNYHLAIYIYIFRYIPIVQRYTVTDHCTLLRRLSGMKSIPFACLNNSTWCQKHSYEIQSQSPGLHKHQQQTSMQIVIQIPVSMLRYKVFCAEISIYKSIIKLVWIIFCFSVQYSLSYFSIPIAPKKLFKKKKKEKNTTWKHSHSVFVLSVFAARLHRCNHTRLYVFFSRSQIVLHPDI